MARAIGVPRQSVGHYLKAGGVKGAQTAAIVGLVARTAVRELLAADERRAVGDVRHAKLVGLLRRFDAPAQPNGRPPSTAPAQSP